MRFLDYGRSGVVPGIDASRANRRASIRLATSGWARRAASGWARRGWVVPALAVVALLGWSTASTDNAQAQDVPNLRREETLETPSTVAMGTGARATTFGTAAALYNAAAMPRRKLYHLESIAGVAIDSGLWSAGTVVTDSITSIVSAAVAVEAIYGSKPTSYSGWDIRLALAMPIGDLISIGVAGRYLRFTPKDSLLGPPGAKGFTFDASLRVEPIKGLAFAALGYNLVDRGSDLVPRLFGGSVGFDAVANLVVGGDLLVDFSTFDRMKVLVGGGAEYRIGDMVPVRLGYRHDTGRRLGQLTAGVGYQDPRFAFDLALRRDLFGGRETQLLLSGRYHVQ